MRDDKVQISDETKGRILRALFTQAEIDTGKTADIPAFLDRKGEWFVGRIAGHKLTQGDANRVKTVLNAVTKGPAFARVSGEFGIRA